MRIRSHLRLLVIVSVAWILFWIAGLPDYYQQYSTKFMIFFDLAILPPIWLIVYRSIKKARPGKGFKISLWWSFYISFPLFAYDFLYCGVYLGHTTTFLWEYWYLTVYYVLPWIIFPPTGWLVDKAHNLTAAQS
jgi:hypothetical protein